MNSKQVADALAEAFATKRITLRIDAGESIDGEQVTTRGAGVIRRLMYKHLIYLEGHSNASSLENLPAHGGTDIGLVYPERLLHAVARVVCTICLMADDPEIMEPVVLRDDPARFEQTGVHTASTRSSRRPVGGATEKTPTT